MADRHTKQSSISSFLVLSFISVGVLMILGGATALWQLNYIHQRAQFLYQSDRPTRAVLRVRNDFQNFQRELQPLARLEQAKPFADEGNRLLKEFGGDVEKAIQAVRTLPSGTQRDMELNNLETVRTLFVGQIESLMALAKSGDWVAVRLRFDSRMPMIGALSESLVHDIDAVVEIEKTRGLEDIRLAQAQATWTMVVASLLALTTAGLLGLKVTQNIAGRLAKLDFAAQALARGEFQHQVVVGGNDEIARLSRAFNEMSSRLSSMYETARRSEAHFRSLIENARDFILVVDANGKVRYTSPSVERVFGNDGPLLGKNVISLVEPEDAETMRNWLAPLALSNNPQKSIEVRLRTAGGTVRTLEIHGTNLLQDPVVAGIVFNARDVTERNLMEEQLRQAQRMEAIGTLSGGVAHDFNNLLTVIRGYAHELLGAVPDAPETLMHAKRIDEAAERAAGLTNQLLAFSRRQVLQPKVFDLKTLVANVDEMLRRLIGEHIEMQTITGADACYIKADTGQIEQVIMNLVINARDAMPHGGKLTLETAIVELDEDYVARHPGTLAGLCVALSIQDTGKGMDAETQAHIFEPFFTTKGLGKGTGLGLSTVYGIVKQSDGNIWVHSEVGKGSTFRVYFPRVCEAPELVVDEESRAADSRGHETILVVEDEPQIRELVELTLISRGYNVLTVDDPVRAADRSKKHAGPIHLLMTDVVMPGISGREVAKQVTAQRPEMKVLFTSGYTPDVIVQHGVLEDGLHFLQKPFTMTTLADKVREVLNGAIARRSVN
jgi:PAS domain S-box-containing protein